MLVCDSITDQALNALDGDRDGLAGGDLVIPFFRSDVGNLLANGHLDGDPEACPETLSPWVTGSQPLSLVTTGLLEVDDFEDAETSTSIRMTVDPEGGAGAAQCVVVPGATPLSFSLQAQVVASESLSIFLIFGCQYFDQPACTGAPISEQSSILGLTDEAGIWRTVHHNFLTPAATASAQCEVLTSSSGAPTGYEIFVDALSLEQGSPASVLIFADGFESGNTSAWQ